MHAIRNTRPLFSSPTSYSHSRTHLTTQSTKAQRKPHRMMSYSQPRNETCSLTCLQTSTSTTELQYAHNTLGMCERRVLQGSLYPKNRCHLQTTVSTWSSSSQCRDGLAERCTYAWPCTLQYLCVRPVRRVASGLWKIG